MRKPEQRLWDGMRRSVAGLGLRLERIENAAGTGIPDVLSLCAGFVVPCELKAQEAPPVRPTTPLLGAAKGLNIDQLNWHLDWYKHGGISLIIVGIGAGSSRKVVAFGGSMGDMVNKLSEKEMLFYAKLRGWSEVKQYLRSHE